MPEYSTVVEFAPGDLRTLYLQWQPDEGSNPIDLTAADDVTLELVPRVGTPATVAVGAEFVITGPMTATFTSATGSHWTAAGRRYSVIMHATVGGIALRSPSTDSRKTLVIIRS